MLSLDVSKAYDRLPRAELLLALTQAQVDPDLISIIMAINDQAKLLIQRGGKSQVIETKQGIRQGCGLSPIVWAIYSAYVLKAIDPRLVNVSQDNTTYADDFLFKWTINTAKDLEGAYEGIRHILQVLCDKGLEISVSKTVIVMQLRGAQAEKALQRYVVRGLKDKRIRFHVQGRMLDIKLVAQHVYLGIIITYGKIEAESFRHRAQLAKGAFKRLEATLTCRTIPITFRWRLWQACVLPCLLHGLDCTGLNPAIAQKIRVLVIGQARRIARSWSMFTREANEDFMDRCGLQDPVVRLQQVHLNRLQKPTSIFDLLEVPEEVSQWRHLLSSQLVEACSGPGLGALDVRIGPAPGTAAEPHVRAKLVPVSLVAEEFLCDQCGFAFATQAALRSHQFKMHFEPADKTRRQTEIRLQQKKDVYEHARDGVPTCVHCNHQVETWPAFTYHVNSRSCAEIRRFYGDPGLRSAIADMPTALVSRDSVLAAAVDVSWRELALLPEVQESFHHCLECHHWSAQPQYVRRHMIAKHKELVPIVRNVELFSAARFWPEQPLQVLWTCFQAEAGSLEVVRGNFNGVYLRKRIARSTGTHGGYLQEATQELELIAALQPQIAATSQAPTQSSTPMSTEARKEPEQEDERQAKFHRGWSKGGSEDPKRRGKGNQQSQRSSKWEDWGRDKDRDNSKKREDQIYQLQSQVGMLTTLLLRRENQMAITRQDTTFMLFLRTDLTPNLASSLYQIGQTWKRMKQDEPDKLKHPMRVILFQHRIGTVAARLEALTGQPENMIKAHEMGWITSNLDCMTCVKCDPEAKKHVLDSSLPEAPTVQAKDMLVQITKLCVMPLVINRFHATRPLAETYSNPTLAMMLEIGLRTEEANTVWRNLNVLSQSSVWVAAGTFLRHDRMQRSALANKLASMNG